MPEIFVLKAAITFHEFHSYCSPLNPFLFFFFGRYAPLVLHSSVSCRFSSRRNTCSFYFLSSKKKEKTALDVLRQFLYFICSLRSAFVSRLKQCDFFVGDISRKFVQAEVYSFISFSPRPRCAFASLLLCFVSSCSRSVDRSYEYA